MKPKEKIKLKLNENDTQKILKEYVNKKNILLNDFSKFLNYEKKKFEMIIKIITEKNSLWCPPINTNLDSLKTNSWFTIKESQTQNVHFNDRKYNLDKLEHVEYKSKRVTLNLNPTQKNIINSWLNAYSDMYNISLGYAKEYVI
jgi:hypothetical protein